jgi:UDP-glucose 4-epimerase
LLEADVRIAVTGSTGFVGRRLCSYGTERGHDMVAVDRRALRAQSFAGIDAIIHLAGIAHRTGVTAEEYDRVNHLLAVEVAERAIRDDAGQFVYVSSVVASPSTDPYARSKAVAESALLAFSERVAIARPALVYGPGAKGNIGSLMRLAALPLPLPLGSATKLRSMIFLDNLCDALLFMVTERLEGGPYVLTDGNDISVTEMVAAFRSARGRSPSLFAAPWLEQSLRVAGLGSMADKLLGEARYDSATIRARGWNAPVPVGEALRRCVPAR